MTIVTAEDIRTFGWPTLAEALTGVRGFYVTNDRNYTYVGVRGFGRPSDYNNRILVLVNGHRFNDNVYDQALVGIEFPIDLALVERIEVIRGPGSALYGTSAFFAVINVVLRPGGARRRQRVSVEVGQLRHVPGAHAPMDGARRRGVDSLLSMSRTQLRRPCVLYFPESRRAGRFGVSRDADARVGDEPVRLGGPRRLHAAGRVRHTSERVPDRRLRDDAWRRPHAARRDSRGWLDAMRHGRVPGRRADGPGLRRL